MVISLSFLNHIARINSAQRQSRSLILKVFVCMGMGGVSVEEFFDSYKKAHTLTKQYKK